MPSFPVRAAILGKHLAGKSTILQKLSEMYRVTIISVHALVSKAIEYVNFSFFAVSLYFHFMIVVIFLYLIKFEDVNPLIRETKISESNNELAEIGLQCMHAQLERKEVPFNFALLIIIFFCTIYISFFPFNFDSRLMIKHS